PAGKIAVLNNGFRRAALLSSRKKWRKKTKWRVRRRTLRETAERKNSTKQVERWFVVAKENVKLGGVGSGWAGTAGKGHSAGEFG
ncbi:MAG: hypothetical protein ACK4I8_05640, partial [Armatimonadota bacterium]